MRLSAERTTSRAHEATRRSALRRTRRTRARRQPLHAPVAAAGARPLAIAVALTLGYALVEVIGGLWSGSLALLADAGHMATDSAALLFALAANIIARRPVSDRHSFGLARVEVIAAFVNAHRDAGGRRVDLLRGHRPHSTHPVQVKGLGVFAIAGIGLARQHCGRLERFRATGRTSTPARRWSTCMGDLLGSVAAIVAGLVIYFGGPLMVGSAAVHVRRRR